MTDEHLKASLWTAFRAGFTAGQWNPFYLGMVLVLAVESVIFFILAQVQR